MKRILSATICLLLLFGIAAPFAASAEESGGKTVRVGWFESTYCYVDSFGRRCGMVYEYQQKIAAYTGWKYEYVEDSWPNLLEKLKKGEIDLLSDVSYTEERAKSILYSSPEMGTENYYIYIAADNDTIDSDDLTTFNGKKIGVNKGSYPYKLLVEWAEKNSLTPEIVEMTSEEFDSMAMVSKGELDAFVSLDSLGAIERMDPVCKIGSSDYYFAVSKARPDLLSEINAALRSIQDEDPYFNQKMMDQWINLTKTNAYLAPELIKWLSAHETVRVGYMDDYMPFCSRDGSTGELTGALKDYLAKASTSLKDASVRFEAVPYTTVGDALAALKNGEVDCVFPVNLSTSDCEKAGIFSVTPAMQTEMSVMMRAEDEPEVMQETDLIIAVDEGNSNYETFIMDNMPRWTIKRYPNVEACYKAVADKEADGVLICNYRTEIMKETGDSNKLVALPTGKNMKLSFAVERSDRELFLLLDKIASASDGEDMGYVLSAYVLSGTGITLIQFLKNNWIIILAVITAISVLLIILLVQKLKAERKVSEQRKQMEEALRRELHQKEQLKSVMKIAYTDPLTGLNSKYAYLEAEEQLDLRIADGSVSEFAMVMFDLNDLKTINDTQGHEVGDRYIREACSDIISYFNHSTLYRIGGDEFVAILEGEDYANRVALTDAFAKHMDENLEKGLSTIAFGCACFDPSGEDSAHAVLERADEMMYQQKKLMKSKEKNRSTVR